MTSETMNRSIPSSWGSTRELRLAGGGPWCSSWAMATPADSMSLLDRRSRLARRRRRALGGHHVLDRERCGSAHSREEVGPHPPRPDHPEGGDDDLLHPEKLQRVHDRPVGPG